MSEQERIKVAYETWLQCQAFAAHMRAAGYTLVLEGGQYVWKIR